MVTSVSKPPMSTGYKAVFALSILMIVVVMVSGMVAESKSFGVGVFYWGYTAWKMYKRDNDSLVLLNKVILWFEGFVYSAILAFTLFASSEPSPQSDLTKLELMVIILAVMLITMLITYCLYAFFKKHAGYGLVVTSIDQSNLSSVGDAYWKAASEELSVSPNVATWAKSFAITDGDEAKAKAMYIKLRAFDLMKADIVPEAQTAPLPPSENDTSFISESIQFWNSYSLFGRIVFILVFSLVLYKLIVD